MGMIVVWALLSFSETAYLLGFSFKTKSRINRGKYPVSGSSLCKNDFLMSEVNGFISNSNNRLLNLRYAEENVGQHVKP